MNNYEDIINLPHHISSKRSQMSKEQRASQFAPFSALTGYEDAIKETARLTNRKIEVDEGLREVLNNKLNIIEENIKNNPEVSITYFIPDKKKEGGEYIKITGIVRRIDIVNNLIIMIDKTKIKMQDVLNITCDLFKDYLEQNN